MIHIENSEARWGVGVIVVSSTLTKPRTFYYGYGKWKLITYQDALKKAAEHAFILHCQYGEHVSFKGVEEAMVNRLCGKYANAI